MKKLFRLSAHLVNVHSQRYRRLLQVESKSPLQVTRVNDIENTDLHHRQSYVFMRRYRGGVSRNLFVFITPLLAK